MTSCVKTITSGKDEKADLTEPKKDTKNTDNQSNSCGQWFGIWTRNRKSSATRAARARCLASIIIPTIIRVIIRAVAASIVSRNQVPVAGLWGSFLSVSVRWTNTKSKSVIFSLSTLVSTCASSFI